jgi:peptide/nickel transport system substrate-binding protein
VSDGSGRDRDLARRSLALLNEAGWELEKGVLRRKGTGEPFTFELLVNGNSSNQERLALNLVQALEKLGIQGRIRSVDEIQYWRRLGRFDYDMIQWSWPVSDSPGSEQRNRWSSEAAHKSGSQNFAGVQSPAVDRLLDSLLEAKTREDFVASVRALDRTLLSGFYVIPLFYVDDQWLVRSSHLRHPAVTPQRGASVETWWSQPD